MLLEFYMEQFKAATGFRIKYWYRSKFTCVGLYLSLEDFEMKVTMRMKWMDCYKDFIETLWCWTNWTGRFAKYFEECYFSVPELIDIWKTDIKLSGDNPYYYAAGGGMTLYNDSTCKPGLLWTDTNPNALPNIL